MMNITNNCPSCCSVSDDLLNEPLDVVEFPVRALVLTVVGFELKIKISVSDESWLETDLVVRKELLEDLTRGDAVRERQDVVGLSVSLEVRNIFVDDPGGVRKLLLGHHGGERYTAGQRLLVVHGAVESHGCS